MNIKNKYIKVAREANVDLEIYTMTFKKTLWLNHKTLSHIKVQNTSPAHFFKYKMVHLIQYSLD